MMKPLPKLQISCTVDPSELESTPEGVFCRKCRKGLADVSRAGERGTMSGGVCGVMRRLAGPVVGSAVALSGCSADSGASDSIRVKPQTDPFIERPEEILVPGSYAYPGEKAPDPDDYPFAERTAEPGIVISPYTGKKVDVSRVPQRTLVIDPAYRMEDGKFFRVPQ
jgi:hypothetical protein